MRGIRAKSLIRDTYWPPTQTFLGLSPVPPHERPSYCSTKRLGVFLNPPPFLDGMLVHRRVTLSINFAGTHLYTWVEIFTVRVKCLAQVDNAMSPARARTRTARSKSSALTMTPPRLLTSRVYTIHNRFLN